MKRFIWILGFISVFFSLTTSRVTAQSSALGGVVSDGKGQPVEAATVVLLGKKEAVMSTRTDSSGHFWFENVPPGSLSLEVRFIGHLPYRQEVQPGANLQITLQENTENTLRDVVVSGTMKVVSRRDSPVPVEVYTSEFFKANPTPSVFDALQQVNGVRPQINCSVCNTGDIHINGLEGPYTMVLIDGMPVVSGLSTVYGLSGIPQSLIDRLEVVKGSASTLYGSEAVGGLINIITKKPRNTPLLAADIFTSSWAELNADLSTRFRAGKQAASLLGINYFNYQRPLDKNGDGFTDLTLQHRLSVFNKWQLDRREDRELSFAARYVYEDRWGGEMHWSKPFRGGDEVYGESIYTNRWELFGTYQLPVKEKVMFQLSANGHTQDAAYADEAFLADQYIAFGQLTWFKTLKKHELLSGLAYRYTYFDDNTPATASRGDLQQNEPSKTHLPGLFVQDQISLHGQHTLILGMRYDYNSLHGHILTPRMNYKWTSQDKHQTLRLSLGNGYRVAHVFTEDHAALTGAREVVFLDDLKPEKSWNVNLNFDKRMQLGEVLLNLDGSAFYTHFSNKIIPDYESDPNKIIYDNLNGYSIAKGLSLNLDLLFPGGLKVLAGGTLMDVGNHIGGTRSRELFSERFSGTWTLTYPLATLGITLDYTGNIYGPMRLPLLNAQDPRKESSPWWSIQNLQVTKILHPALEVYGGVKNLLNWTVSKGNPFIIARAHDPFDRKVKFGPQGEVLPTLENPYALSFDPDSYAYGPNQGIRGFLGIRYTLYQYNNRSALWEKRNNR